MGLGGTPGELVGDGTTTGTPLSDMAFSITFNPVDELAGIGAKGLADGDGVGVGLVGGW